MHRLFRVKPWPDVRRAILEKGLWVGFASVLLLTVYGQISSRLASYWVRHTFEVLESIQETQSHLLNAQSKYQDFFVNGATPSLLQYELSMGEARKELANLVVLTSDNSVQQANLDTLRLFVQNTSTKQQSAIDYYLLRRVVPPEVKADAVSIYDDINAAVEQVRSMEKELLEKRQNRFNNQVQVTSSGTLLSLIALIILVSFASKERQRQRAIKHTLSAKLKNIEQEHNLSSYLLTCRDFQEAHQIVQSYLLKRLPDASGAIFEISNSRDQMSTAITFGGFSPQTITSPGDCWALRRGQVVTGEELGFEIPCSLCHLLHGDTKAGNRICLPLAAHEKTVGILHLTNIGQTNQHEFVSLGQQIALPMAVLHLQSELRYLSFYDSGTNLNNRLFLDEMLERAIATAKRKSYGLLEQGEQPYTIGVIFLDVDHFKRFNDTYGHSEGDAVLRTVGSCLRESIRAGEDVAARYGGEEFVVCLVGAPLEQVVKKANAIRELIKGRSAPSGGAITVSSGVAVFPIHGSTAKEILEAAKGALRQAKQAGRDCVVVANSEQLVPKDYNQPVH